MCDGGSVAGQCESPPRLLKTAVGLLFITVTSEAHASVRQPVALPVHV
jgi:hypothetical protein